MRHVVAMLLYLAKYSTYQCRVWALIDTATRISSFTAPAYLVTESYGGKILDSFSIKLLNRFTYLPETQAPGLFEQALAINVAVFTVSSTQARVFERFSNLECSIRKNSMLRSAVPAHDDANRRVSPIRKSTTEFYRVMHAAYFRPARSTTLMRAAVAYGFY